MLQVIAVGLNNLCLGRSDTGSFILLVVVVEVIVVVLVIFMVVEVIVVFWFSRNQPLGKV